MVSVDANVSRLKYEREVERLKTQRQLLQSRGIFLLEPIEFPVIELIFVPRRPIQIIVEAQQAGAVALPEGTVATVEIPALSGMAFRAHFDLTDYDLRAPSLEFRDAWANIVLSYNTMLRALEFEEQRKAHLVLLDNHPVTHKPFLCLRGVREYHEHPQHSGDDWLLYRTHINLFSIVMSLWRVSIDLVRPVLIPEPKPKQVRVHWVAEEKK